jgi:L-lactate dehydrogenase complex protein LldG
MPNSSATSRRSILDRLRAVATTPLPPSDFTPLARRGWSAEQRLDRLRQMMSAVNTEFVETTQDLWPQAVAQVLADSGATSLAIGPHSPAGARLLEDWSGEQAGLLRPFGRPIESHHDALFNAVDAGLTEATAGIAETGSLILWPGPHEPRSLSLVPPLHLCLLRADQLFDTFYQALKAQDWVSGLPTNALLVSGPSKTADIEQTLAYGVHGPKRLVVLLIL